MSPSCLRSVSALDRVRHVLLCQDPLAPAEVEIALPTGVARRMEAALSTRRKGPLIGIVRVSVAVRSNTTLYVPLGSVAFAVAVSAAASMAAAKTAAVANFFMSFSSPQPELFGERVIIPSLTSKPVPPAGVSAWRYPCVATPLWCGCCPASSKPTKATRSGSASGHSEGGAGGITIIVAPGIAARVAARLAATSAGMPAAEISNGAAEANAALGAAGVGGGIADAAAPGAGLFAATTVAAGALFTVDVIAPLFAAGAPREAKTRHGAPGQTPQRHAGCTDGLAVLAVLQDYRDSGAWRRGDDLANCHRGGPGGRHR